MRINNDCSAKKSPKKKSVKVHEILLLRTHPLLHELFFVFPSTFLFLRSCLILSILSSFYTLLFFSLSLSLHPLSLDRTLFLSVPYALLTHPFPHPLAVCAYYTHIGQKGTNKSGLYIFNDFQIYYIDHVIFHFAVGLMF